MVIREGLWYHKEHEWIRVDGIRATLGISDFAQEALGDIVYLEFPAVGRTVKPGAAITEVESTKTTSPVYAPVGGTIVAVNETLKDRPELINKDPYGDGWIAVIEMNQPKEVEKLMTASAYEKFLKAEAH